MIPLSLCKTGEVNKVIKVSGTDEVKSHLNDLGFVEGTEVSIINELAGNIIVSVKDSRVAIDRGLANKIMVE